MKKSLVVLLALVMVLAFAATAVAANPGSGDTQIASYTDLADTKDEWAAAVYKLTALGVLQGDGIGTKYRPADNLTRGEFAVIATYLAGVEDQVAFYATKPAAFSDANGWEKAYVNCAYANDLMIGRSATKFDPKGKVSMQEVATVVLRVLGYNFDSTYPVGYANKAEAIGLLDYVQYIGPTYINRAEMASIAAQALDCAKVQYVGKDSLTSALGLVDKDGYVYEAWSTNDQKAIKAILGDVIEADIEDAAEVLAEITSNFFSTFTGRTLLYSVFGCIDFEAIFNWSEDAELLEAGAWAYSDFDKGQIVGLFVSEQDSNYDEEQNRDPIFTIPFADEYYIYGGELVDLTYQVATITLNIDNDKAPGEMVFVDLDSTVAFGTKTKAADESLIKFFSHDDINLFKSDNGVKAYFAVNYADYKDMKYGVVKSVSSTKVTMITDAIGSDLDSIDIGKNDQVVFWNMDTKEFITPDKLVKGDVVYDAGQLNSQRGEEADLYLVYNATSGNLTKYNAYHAVIDDVTYGATAVSQKSVNNLVSLTEWTGENGLAKEVKFAASYVPGYFTYIANATTSYVYGVVDEYLYKNGTGDGTLWDNGDEVEFFAYAVEVLLPDGTVATYEFSKDINDDLADYAYEEDDVALCEVGDLALITLNKDGKVAEMQCANESSDAKTALGVTPTHFDYGNDQYIDVDKATGRIRVDDGDVYTLNSDAVIYILESKDGDYKIDSAKLMTTEDFLDKYDDGVEAGYVHVAKYSGTKVAVLYVVDPVIVKNAIGVTSYSELKVWTNTDGSSYYITIDGVDYTIKSKAVYDAIKDAIDLVFQDTAVDSFFLYETENGKLVDFAAIGLPELEDGEAYWSDDATNIIANKKYDHVYDLKKADSRLSKDYVVGIGEITKVESDRIEIDTDEDGTKDLTLFVEDADKKFTVGDANYILFIYEENKLDDLVAYIFDYYEEGDAGYIDPGFDKWI